MKSRLRKDRFSDAAESGAAFSPAPRTLSGASRRAAAAGRFSVRLLILIVSLAQILFRFLVLRLRRGSRIALADRAQWLHGSCRLVLSRLGVATRVRGPRPQRGLVCSNHLSYLDIAVLAAAAPCLFVSKREIGRWPIFGFFARCAGTIFLDRQSHASAETVAAEMVDALDRGVPVLLFPEGTSTDGREVLRFHSTLLEPAVQKGLEMTAAAVAYRLHGGRERDLCYYGDIAFLPHLVRTMGRRGIAAEVEFYPDPAVYPERKIAALDLRERVVALRSRMLRGAE